MAPREHARMHQAMEGLRLRERELSSRIDDLRDVSQAAHSALQARYEPLLRLCGELAHEAQSLVDAPRGLLRRRVDPGDLLARIQAAAADADAAVAHAVDLSAAPAQAGAAVQTVVSRLAVTDQVLADIGPRGADTGPITAMAAQLQAGLAHVRSLLEKLDFFNARDLARQLVEDSVVMDQAVRAEQAHVTRLTVDAQLARDLLATVQASADRTSEVVAGPCPALASSVATLERVRVTCQAQAAALRTIHGTQVPTGATTIVRQALEQLGGCALALQEIGVLEGERNFVWSTCSQVAAELASILTDMVRPGVDVDPWWSRMDQISGLLTSGSVAEAARLQHQLAREVRGLYRPALTATAPPEPWGEEVLEEEELGTEWRAPLPVMSSAEQMAHLRALVMSMAEQVHEMRREA